MDKQARKELKKRYLEAEKERLIEAIKNDNGSDPLKKFTKILLAPPLKQLTKEFIQTAPDELMEIELVKKIKEEVAATRKMSRTSEKEAELSLSPFKRMVFFTHIFEEYAGLGDIDKFMNNALPYEVEGTIEGYKLLDQLDVARLIIEAKETDDAEYAKLYSYFDQENRLDDIIKHKIAFIRQNAGYFLYE